LHGIHLAEGTAFGQSGDNRVTALDALQVINTLAHVQTGAEGERLTLQNVPPNNTDRSRERFDTEVFSNLQPIDVETPLAVITEENNSVLADETSGSRHSLKEQEHDQALSDPSFFWELKPEIDQYFR
jgi:hypothetical protein